MRSHRRRLRCADRLHGRLLATLLALPLAALVWASRLGEYDAAAQGVSAVNQAFAVVVHADNGIGSLTLEEVRAIFMLDQQFWPNGHRVAVLLPPPGSPEREILLRKVFAMNDAQLHRYWVAKLFRGEIPAVPLVLGNERSTADAVRRSRESISIAVVNRLNPGVRVLSIGGLQPGDPGYPLAADDAGPAAVP
jgi:hypothetical protein